MDPNKRINQAQADALRKYLKSFPTWQWKEQHEALWKAREKEPPQVCLAPVRSSLTEQQTQAIQAFLESDQAREQYEAVMAEYEKSRPPEFRWPTA
jgi:hypothetical protein